MRKTLVLAGMALLLAGPVMAADLATKQVYKAPPLVPVFTWTGCYLGADVGGAWAKQTAATTPVNVNQAPLAGDLSRGSGVIGGPYVGCNYQFMSGLVLGAEGDFSWTHLNGAADGPNLFANGAPVGSGGVNMTSSTDWIASLRARLGYAIMPNVLVYGTGGAAWARTAYTGFDAFQGGCANCLTTSFTDTGKGWVAGGGVEWAPWSNNWILRLEYLHYELGGASSTASFNPTQFTTFTFGDLKVDSVRAGLSYKF